MPPPPDAALRELPRGRHDLTREQVRDVQRARLLRAMTEEVAEKGFASTTAAGVYGRARVSSRAFYESFSDVRDCFLAAYAHCAALTEQALQAGPAPADAPPLVRLRRLLRTYLELVRDEPAVARTFLVEVYAAGPDAVAARLAVHRRFVDVVLALAAEGRTLTDDDRAAVTGVVDAVTLAVTLRVAARDVADLSALEPDLLVLARRACPWLEETA